MTELKTEVKENCGYVLAMYDIRGKQKYIYRSRKIKEIVGGSMMIRNIFSKYLFSGELCGEKGSYKIFNDSKVPFSENSFKKHLEQGYVGELVYDGGGNFLVVFKDWDNYDKVTYEFTKKVIQETATLNILPTCVPVTSFSNFHCNERDRLGRLKRQGDYEKLYAVHRLNEAMDTGIRPWGTLPGVQVDYTTSMPLVRFMKIAYDDKKDAGGAIWKKVTAESVGKYNEYLNMEENDKNKIGARWLDDLVEDKGKDSLLAVIYIDGNNMGAQFQKCVDQHTDYEGCIKELRKFSNKIQREYIDIPLQKIDEKLVELHGNDIQSRRMVVYAGDEITLICNAHDAIEIVKTYFNSLPSDDSSCAGICIFQSHMPYADAYHIAEECCENGKKEMRSLGLTNVCFTDFHYCQGAIGSSLKDIRERENLQLISRPWIFREGCDAGDKEKLSGFPDIEKIEKISGFMSIIGRTNIKNLAVPARYSKAEYYFELERIKAHMETEEKQQVDFELLKQNRELVYDMITVYDLWFRKREVNE